MYIKNSVLDYIKIQTVEMVWSRARMDEEREDSEIRGCRRLQQE